ncbi:hypothetical protein HCG68_00255 [Paeniclostridium sordellii]|nr:hypothetical protein [Paeniclostridium sordellii]
MSEFKFITKNDMTKELFFKLPKALMYETKYKDMSANAKILYSMLLDRTNLSIENDWFDSNDRAYIICEIDEVEIFLNCARATAVKSIKELEKYNLIMKIKRGQGKANLLYVAHVDTSKETLNTHLKLHKRMVDALKSKRESQKEMYLCEKFKKCTPLAITKVTGIKTLKSLKLLKSSETEFNRVQNLDGNNTEVKETEVVVVDSELKSRIDILDRYCIKFNLTKSQETLLKSYSLDVFELAVKILVASNRDDFKYFIGILNNSISKITKAKSNNKQKQVRTSQHNINQTYKKYSPYELESLLLNNQKNKFTECVKSSVNKVVSVISDIVEPEWSW